MRVLDIFAGTGSSTLPFADRGHEVIRVELERQHVAELHLDVRQLAKDPVRYLGAWRPDFIWASPPCTAYSMAGPSNRAAGTASRRWQHLEEPHPFYGPRIPKDRTARDGVACVLAALEVVAKLRPRFWAMENPQGGLKTMGFMRDVPGPATVTYCRYGDFRMKPTNIWGNVLEVWTPRPRCKNGDPCHEAAPRGAKTGTQRLATVDRSKVPYSLGAELCVALERAMAPREVELVG